MIGLGVGIDYALFIVTRYREQLHDGPRRRARRSSIAIDTAGRAVAFAGHHRRHLAARHARSWASTFVAGLGIGAAVVVAVTMVASLTLLPALLGFAGTRVEVTRWRGLIAAGLVAVGLVGVGLERPAARCVGAPAGRRRAGRRLRRRPAARARCRAAPPSRCARPSPTAGAASSSTARGRRRSAAPSCCSCSPSRCSACASASPTRATTPRTPPPARPTTCWPRASGPGFNGPLLARRRAARRAPTPRRSSAVTDALAADPGRGLRHARRARTTRPSPTAVLVAGHPRRPRPQDEATTELVDRLRDDVLPPADRGHRSRRAASPAVAAVSVDFSDYLAGRLPLFFGVGARRCRSCC